MSTGLAHNYRGAVPVEWCMGVFGMFAGCVWYVCCYVRKKALLQCLYEVLCFC